MSNEVLVTDSLFIDESDMQRLRDAGLNPTRLDVVCAAEEELIAALQGKVGYIIGGMEKTTRNVIDACPELRAIAFTGSGFAEWIPDWAYALEKKVGISACVGAVTPAVVQYTIGMALAMLRNQFALNAENGPGMSIGNEWSAQTIGVVGYGHIGKAVAEQFSALGFKVVVASYKDRECSFPVASLEEVLKMSDLVTVHVSPENGNNALDAAAIGMLKDGAVLLKMTGADAIDESAAIRRAQAGEIRVGFDPRPKDLPADLPPGAVVGASVQGGFYTHENLRRVNDRTVTALIDMLAGNPNADIVSL